MKQLDIRFDPPKLIPSMMADDPFMQLAEDWEIEFRGETWVIPAGFRSDGASIPWWLEPVCGSPWKSPRIIAALVHDSNYAGNDPEATRREADDLYRDMQIACGVGRRMAYVEWFALRLFGRSHWQGWGDPS